MSSLKIPFFRELHVFLLFRFNLNKILSSTKNITQLQIGESAIIGEFTNCHIACKLMAMGLLPGTEILLQRTAPFGGGYYVKTNNHYIALRSQEANNVLLIAND